MPPPSVSSRPFELEHGRVQPGQAARVPRIGLPTLSRVRYIDVVQAVCVEGARGRRGLVGVHAETPPGRGAMSVAGG